MENKLTTWYKKKYSYCFFAFICFLISPVLSIFMNLYLLYKSENSKEKYIIIVFIALSFGYLGYHTIPIESQDLFRHYKIINILSHVPIDNFLLYSYPGVPLNTCVMYLCAVLNNPALYSLIYLSIGFYIIFFLFIKFQDRCNLNFVNMILVILLVLLCMNFRYYYSGLRNHFSFLLCMLVIYRSFFCKKNDWINILLFLVSFFIHVGAMIVILVFYTYKLFYEKIPQKFKRKINIGIPLCGFLLIIIVDMMSIIFPSLMNITIFSKVYEYINTLSISNFTYYIFLIVFMIFMFILVLKLKSFDFEKSNNYLNFVFFFILITISISWNMELLVRFSYMLSFLSLPVHMLAMKKLNSKKSCKNTYYFAVVFIIVFQILFNIVFNFNYPWLFDKNIFDLLFIV